MMTHSELKRRDFIQVEPGYWVGPWEIIQGKKYRTEIIFDEDGHQHIYSCSKDFTDAIKAEVAALIEADAVKIVVQSRDHFTFQIG